MKPYLYNPGAPHLTKQVNIYVVQGKIQSDDKILHNVDIKKS